MRRRGVWPTSWANVLIEIRRDPIDPHHGADAWAGPFGPLSRALLADPGLHVMEHER